MSILLHKLILFRFLILGSRNIGGQVNVLHFYYVQNQTFSSPLLGIMMERPTSGVWDASTLKCWLEHAHLKEVTR